MRRTHSFEIVGIGEFDEFPAKVKPIEYATITKSGKPVVKKVLTQGNSSEYAWFDNDGKTYTKEEVGYDVNGKFVQKVERTDKVSKYDIVSVAEIVELLESDTSFVLPKNETALKHFKDIVPDGKAMKFTYKKSSVGMNFVKAYLYDIGGELCMITGGGNRTKALEQFKASKKVAKGNDMPNEVVVSADEITPNLD